VQLSPACGVKEGLGMPRGRWDGFTHPQSEAKGEEGKEAQGCPARREPVLGMRLELQRGDPQCPPVRRHLHCRDEVEVTPGGVRGARLEVVRFDLWCLSAAVGLTWVSSRLQGW